MANANYEFERECMRNAIRRVSALLALSNSDEVDNVIQLTNCMTTIVCQIRNLDEHNVSLYAVDTADSSDDDEIDFTIE